MATEKLDFALYKTQVYSFNPGTQYSYKKMEARITCHDAPATS